WRKFFKSGNSFSTSLHTLLSRSQLLFTGASVATLAALTGFKLIISLSSCRRVQSPGIFPRPMKLSRMIALKFRVFAGEQFCKILKSDNSCISNPKFEVANWTAVQSKISNFGFEMQELSDFKIAFDLTDPPFRS